jgi:hypothetical protein
MFDLRPYRLSTTQIEGISITRKKINAGAGSNSMKMHEVDKRKWTVSITVVSRSAHNSTCCRMWTANIKYITNHNSGHYPSSCVLFKTWRLGDWILSPSSGGTTQVGSINRVSLSLSLSLSLRTPATTPKGLIKYNKNHQLVLLLVSWDKGYLFLLGPSE